MSTIKPRTVAELYGHDPDLKQALDNLKAGNPEADPLFPEARTNAQEAVPSIAVPLAAAPGRRFDPDEYQVRTVPPGFMESILSKARTARSASSGAVAEAKSLRRSQPRALGHRILGFSAALLALVTVFTALAVEVPRPAERSEFRQAPLPHASSGQVPVVESAARERNASVPSREEPSKLDAHPGPARRTSSESASSEESAAANPRRPATNARVTSEPTAQRALARSTRTAALPEHQSETPPVQTNQQSRRSFRSNLQF